MVDLPCWLPFRTVSWPICGRTCGPCTPGVGKSPLLLGNTRFPV